MLTCACYRCVYLLKLVLSYTALTVKSDTSALTKCLFAFAQTLPLCYNNDRVKCCDAFFLFTVFH